MIATVLSTLCAGPTFGGKSFMIFAPHPDDETLFAGGIINAAVSRGDSVWVVVVTNGDIAGTSTGYAREAESISAMNLLGLGAQGVIFLGYGDQSLMTLYTSRSDTLVYQSKAGQTQTYANQGFGNTDFHDYYYGVPGPYNRQTIAQDIQNVLTMFRPTDIYITSIQDSHPDHEATYLFVVEAILRLRNQGYSYPRLHESIVHAPCDTCDPNYRWPMPAFTPTQPFPKPPYLDTTPLEWNLIESVPVPPSMQIADQNSNLKYQALKRYQTQVALAGDWLFAFVKQNEFFWLKNFEANLAFDAKVSVSSENTATGQLGVKAVDGVVDGEPGVSTAEWATIATLPPPFIAWINLSWNAPIPISQVILYDRRNQGDQVMAGTLRFSDGSSIPVGALPNNGAGLVVTFPQRTVTSLEFDIEQANGFHVGLAEIEVYVTPFR